VVPEFYTRDAVGVPIAWVTRMRESMAQLTPQFSTNRAVSEYTERHYLPAATRFRQRAKDQCAIARQIVDWQHNLKTLWQRVRFVDVKVTTCNHEHAFEVQLFLGELHPESVQVELYADNPYGAAERVKLKRDPLVVATSDLHRYRATIFSARPAVDYTVRLIPCFAEVAVPLEEAHILWQR
jgi:glycogen phosphorylase